MISSSGITDFHNIPKKNGKGVITGRYGTLGKFFFVDGPYWPLNTTLYVTDFKGNNPRFVYYFLQTLDVERFNGASAVPGLDRNVIHGATVSFLFDLPLQTRIADLLSAYDELIEVNNRRIALLEQTAEQLYKEWFVRLRFPGYAQTKVRKGVPEGWSVKKLGELYKTSSGGTPSRKNPGYYEGGQYNWIKTKELNDSFLFDTEEKITDAGLENSSAKLFPPRTVIMAMYGATIGKLGITTKAASTNQACCAILKKNDFFSEYYAFSFLSSYRQHLIGMSVGAAQQNISQAEIKKTQMLAPPKSILKSFNLAVGSIFDQIQTLQAHNQTLRRTRDLLLPRLISGQLSVAEAETALNA